VNAPVDELMALNPSLLRMATPPDTSFDLHLPAGTAALFQERVEAIPESKRNAWRYHRVTSDDTLESVARTYRVSPAELAAANQLRSGEALSGLEAVVVPVAPVAAPALHTLLYTTRRGDTLVSIADRFGVSLDQLRRWNKIPTGIRVDPGRRLHVAEPAMVRRTKGRSRTTITAADLKSHTGAASSHHASSTAGKQSMHARSSSTSQRAHAKPQVKAQK
jgi:membrane-bound lytic murein transglycosylase D